MRPPRHWEWHHLPVHLLEVGEADGVQSFQFHCKDSAVERRQCEKDLAKATGPIVTPGAAPSAWRGG
eukprot:10442107-Prorocentrum_lima.AAC.1